MDLRILTSSSCEFLKNYHVFGLKKSNDVEIENFRLNFLINYNQQKLQIMNNLSLPNKKNCGLFNICGGLMTYLYAKNFKIIISRLIS